MKTNIALTFGNFELELHGVIHVSKNNQYQGCIEFKSGKNITGEMVRSAIDNTIEYFGGHCTPKDIVEITSGVRRIMDCPRCIFQKGNLFLSGFEGPWPNWTEDRVQAKSYPKKYDYDIIRSCYRADPDSDLIVAVPIDN
jgi:hypothetical protein